MKTFRRLREIKIYLRKKGKCTGVREGEIENTGNIRGGGEKREPRRRLKVRINTTERAPSRSMSWVKEGRGCIQGLWSLGWNGEPSWKVPAEDKASNNDHPSLKA